MQNHKSKSLLSAIEESILGPRDKFELDRRLACFISFVFFLLAFISVFLDIIFNLPKIEIFFLSVATLIFLSFYFLFRTKKWKENGYLVLFISSELSLCFVYFTSGGITGPIAIYFLLIFIPIFFTTKDKHWFYLIVVIIIICILMGLEQKFPNLIFHIDHIKSYIFTSFLFVLIALFFVLKIVIRAYNDERIKVQNQKNEIEKQHNHIHELMERETRINQMKLNFFTNMSHEFRTPLTLLTAPVELLIEKENDPQKIEYYNTIKKNAAQLKQMVDEILDLRKLDSGSLKLNLQKKDIVEFIKGITHSFTSLTEVQKIDLQFTDHIKEAFVMVFDPEKVEKIFSNILLNAFKYTPSGGKIKVDVSLYEDKGRKIIKTKITDTGKGIPADIIGDIFNPFYQAPDTLYGTGIGLTLANEYTKLHQGYIEAESELNKGTSFSVFIPADLEAKEALFTSHRYSFESHVPVIGDIVETDDEDGLVEEKKEKLLVIDDNDTMVKYVDNMFAGEYSIFKAYDGKEGFDKAIECTPDIILSDIMMPEVDGIELCRRLKTDERTSHIPVILLTAKAAETDKITGLDTGADAYITKPFSMKELKASVRNLLHTRKVLREKFQKNIIYALPKEVVTTETDEKFLEEAIKCVEKNMENTMFGVPELVEKMNISRSLLHLKLKKLTDMSTSQFITAIRLRKAAKLLAQTDESISEICYKVGYNDPSHFSSGFKKMFGATPSKYRKK